MTPAQGNKKASESLQPDQYLEPKWLRCSTSPLLCGVEKLFSVYFTESNFSTFLDADAARPAEIFNNKNLQLSTKKKFMGPCPLFSFFERYPKGLPHAAAVKNWRDMRMSYEQARSAHPPP
jgi:hypothetical protein